MDGKFDLNQEEVWDLISESWKESRERQISIVVDFLKNKKGKVIDLGCGAGRNLIKNNNLSYTGVDFSKGQLKYAEEYAKKNKIKASFIKANLDKLPLKKGEFDYGLFMASLHCVEGVKERELALREFYRVLKKNSEALLSVWDRNQPRFKNKKEIYLPWDKENEKTLRYYYLYEKEELVKLLQKVGFKIIEFYKDDKDRFIRRNIIVRIKK